MYAEDSKRRDPDFIPKLFVVLFLMLTMVSKAQDDAEYWNYKLGNTTLPNLLKYMVQTKLTGEGEVLNPIYSSFKIYSYDYETDTPLKFRKNLTSMFIRKNMVKSGYTVDHLFYMSPKHCGAPFLRLNDSRASNILSTTSDSEDGRRTEFSIRRCKRTLDERHACVHSMRGMVDFVIQEFGSSAVQALGVNVTSEMEQPKKYVITRVRRLAEKGHTISCHKAPTPFGLFFCHRPKVVIPFRLSLESLDGHQTRVDDAFVACHEDTQHWNPGYVAFEVLGLKPGETVCHFLGSDSVWFLKI